MEKTEKMELIVNVNGSLAISEQVDKLLVEYKETKILFETAETELRTALLTAMIENGVLKGETKNFTIIQVVPTADVRFDSNKFLDEESDDMIMKFVEVKSTRQFDFEKFRTEQPEMYAKYETVLDEYIIDEKKLKKTFEEVYNKYVTITPSKKAVSLRITEKK